MDYIGIIKQRKVINGKLYHRYFVDSAGEEIGLPAGIYLTTSGPFSKHNYVTNSGIRKQFPGSMGFAFPYNNKQTQEKALKDMIVACATLTHSANKTCTRLRNLKKTTIDHGEEFDPSELPAGVSFVNNRAKRTPFKVFAVSYYDPVKKGFSCKTIYVGTENTWRQNYAKNLKKAIVLREESLKIYRELINA